MIDHLLGRPSPSWKRAQVCRSPHSIHNPANSAPGLSRPLLLGLETRLWKPWRTTLLVVETVEQETPYVHTLNIISPIQLATQNVSPHGKSSSAPSPPYMRSKTSTRSWVLVVSATFSLVTRNERSIPFFLLSP